MKKAFTLIEMILAITVGLLIFQMLFSSNLVFAKIYSNSVGQSKKQMSQANSFLYLYRTLSNAQDHFTNYFEGRINRGFFSFQDVQGNLQTFYLYAPQDFEQFIRNQFTKEYCLMNLQGQLTERNYGDGKKILTGVKISETDWLMSYSLGRIAVNFILGEQQINYQLRVKN